MSHSQEAMDESFLMTNMSPQVGVGFNRGYWARLEGFMRHLAGQYDAIYVVTGPLFLPKVVGHTHYFHNGSIMLTCHFDMRRKTSALESMKCHTQFLALHRTPSLSQRTSSRSC
jgi:hypothetical protein